MGLLSFLTFGLFGRKEPAEQRLHPAFENGENEDLIHRPSGMVFPSWIDTRYRAEIRIYDPEATNFGVIYDAPGNLAISVFIYQNPGASITSEIETLKSRMVEKNLANPEALIRDTTRGNLKGLLILMNYDNGDNFFCQIFEKDGWFLKIMITYPEDQEEALEQEYFRFLDEYPWP